MKQYREFPPTIRKGNVAQKQRASVTQWQFVQGRNRERRSSLTTAPAAPGSKAASGITASGFTANWNPSIGATSYRLDVSTVSNFGSFVSGYNNKTLANVTTSPVTGLASGTHYYFRVRAVNDAGTGPSSQTQSLLTL